MDQLDITDIYKCLLSLAAGLLLGLEREMKDKAAGVKTISIICLGATLFSILSLRFDPDRATALAAYIVSGVGFLGAGVIFKDGVSISGLTTASIIWMAAAVGTSIGFGEFWLAGMFLFGSFIIIWVTPLLNKVLDTKKQNKMLTLRFAKHDYLNENEVMRHVTACCKKITVQKTSLDKDRIVEVTIEIVIDKKEVTRLSQYLMDHPKVVSFNL
jgi:putative Mg2+ transporter-C (MgtC) family protein